MKEAACDSFASARRPVRQTGFLLYKELYNIAAYLSCYLDGIRCSWIVIFHIYLIIFTPKYPVSSIYHQISRKPEIPYKCKGFLVRAHSL